MQNQEGELLMRVVYHLVWNQEDKPVLGMVYYLVQNQEGELLMRVVHYLGYSKED